MVNPNELRMGNLISHDGLALSIYGVANQERGESIVWYDEEGGFYLNCNEINPIPITPEILIACGFQSYQNYTGLDRYVDNNSLYGEIEREGDGWNIADYESGSICKKPFYYVHQFQNLYFALTGEEVKINLELIPS